MRTDATEFRLAFRAFPATEEAGWKKGTEEGNEAEKGRAERAEREDGEQQSKMIQGEGEARKAYHQR